MFRLSNFKSNLYLTRYDFILRVQKLKQESDKY